MARILVQVHNGEHGADRKIISKLFERSYVPPEGENIILDGGLRAEVSTVEHLMCEPDSAIIDVLSGGNIFEKLSKFDGWGRTL